MRARLAAVAVFVAVALGSAGTADAAWQASGGGGSAYAKARSLPQGDTPAAAVSGRNVTVSWTEPAGSVPIAGYVVRRYDGGGTEQTVGAACSGIVAGLSCTENDLAPGTWRYTVTPARQNWRGAESAQSSAVTVNSPAMALSPATVNALPATLTGQITSFKAGQTVTFRLDDPASGTVLTGSIVPTPVPSNGTSDVSVTLPADTSNGAHTIYAIGSAGDQASAGATVVRPLVSDSVIAKSAGGDSGYIRQGGTYYVYANVSGSGSPPAGLSTLRADVSNVTAGQTNVTMTNGTFTVGGQSYNYRSAQLTADTALSAGSKSYALTLTDTAGSATVTNHTVIVDNTAPTGSNVQTANGTGGTAGRAELGDTITFTYSEPIEPVSILAGWSGSSTNVVVQLADGGLLSNDTAQIRNAADSATLPLGSVNLGRSDYKGLLSSASDFGASGTPSTMVRSGNSIVITLGTASGGAVTTAGGTGTMSWSPSATATDRAGNAASTAATAEVTPPADAEF